MSENQISEHVEAPSGNIIDDVDDDALNDDQAGAVYKISSYGADYTVDGIVNRLNSGAFFVPDFQRSYIWTRTQASRFIESLLLNLPVPGVFLAKEEDTKKHLVVDGQQRLKSLQYFFRGKFGEEEKEFRLQKIDDRWSGKSFKDLGESDRLSLEDSIIHCTIFSQLDPDDNDTSLHEIFDRLNTGGTKCYPQEIRNCVDHGKITELLSNCNDYKAWRDIFGEKKSPRFKDHELILRFFAFLYDHDAYKRPMREFLDKFSHRNRRMRDERALEMRDIFEATISAIAESVGEKAFRPEKYLNAAVYDAIMVGLARRLQTESLLSRESIRESYDFLISDSEFMNACGQSTSDETNVRVRQTKATEAFSG